MIPNKEGRKHAMKGKKDKDAYFQATTMIDPATDCCATSQNRPSC